MTSLIQKKLIELIKVNFVENEVTFPEPDVIENLLLTAFDHHIFNLVFYGLKKCSGDNNAKLGRLLPAVCKNISIAETQSIEIEKIEKAFCDAGIDYAPLKGAVMKKYYPKTDMRSMTDFDVLIRVCQYEKIKTVMESLGFELKVESNHEYVWFKKGILYVELHKMLIPSYNDDFYSYFKDGWSMVKEDPQNPHRFKMSDEDFYIYNFVHLAKHYRDGGVGVKHVVDLWVLKNALPQLDFNYIDQKIDEIGLSKFHENILKLISVWFENEQSDLITEALAERIINSGAYGTKDLHLISYAAKNTRKKSTFWVRLTHILSMLFPSYAVMKQKHSILKKAPLLLPIFWFIRLFGFVFNKQKIAKHFKDVKSLNGERVVDYVSELDLIGLKFNSLEDK